MSECNRVNTFMSAVGLILFISECNRVKTVADLLHFML